MATVPISQEIITDGRALSIKKKMMKSLRWNSILGSVSQVATFIGGPLMAAGLTAAAMAFMGTVAQTGSLAAAISGITLASIGGLTTVGILATGALFVTAAVGSNYLASRIWQSRMFDNYEISAVSTAKHMVEEIKSNNMCFVKEEPARTDGKSWAQFVRSQESGEQSQSL